MRNAVGVFDTSPLYKYRITGPDAERLLSGALARDIRTCRPGQAHYTAWCDDRGFVMHDGVAFRHAADDFLLTAGRPTLSWFQELASGLRVRSRTCPRPTGCSPSKGRARVPFSPP